MSSKKDWRLDGQEEYLRGATLYHVAFTPLSEQWDHEHCVSCWLNSAQTSKICMKVTAPIL